MKSSKHSTRHSNQETLRSSPISAVVLENVSKRYGKEESLVTALDDISIAFRRCSFTAVMGPSGSGKSTLLQCAAGLDRPTSGRVFIQDTELSLLREPALTKFRREHIGFVFQSFNLLPSLNVRENIVLPLRMSGRRPDRAQVSSLIERVGLSEKERRRPAELSGGQQQRVAIARAIITFPDVIMADEPTGALDSRTGTEILSLLREIVQNERQTVVMVTHDPVAASFADRVIFLADGMIVDSMEQPTSDAVAARLARLGGE